ncbi:uncharacterized protein LOC110734931 [Chenopodium quinoa]|uniref:uncharacterized protein LOC110734931 n=1 Tax=Chenopodium quinoa TaxID=63459 RepID=UPI000B77C6E5|nr:uncharacterized protein LOC110734931 [Chenopodium quinoa]
MKKNSIPSPTKYNKIIWSLLWGIWIRRNEWVYAGKKKEIAEVIHKAMSLVGEYESAKDQAKVSSASEVLECQWKAPPTGIIKVNSDAAIFDPDKVGLGGLMRDNVGDVVAATCLRMEGKYDVDVVEAMALRHALVIAMEAGFVKVCLETDNLKLHHMIIVCRSGNRVAHNLAKLSINCSSLRVWLEEYPAEIQAVVMADINSSST